MSIVVRQSQGVTLFDESKEAKEAKVVIPSF